MLVACVATIMVNLSKEPWNKEDQNSLLNAMFSCSKYYEDSPCVIKFIKKEPSVYNVICGKPK